MSTIEEELLTNKAAWNKVAEKFTGVCALPAWGPFGVCADMDLLGSLAGKSILEVGCGSGHSIRYVVEHGAERVYGIDLSPAQIAFASELNREHISTGRVQFYEAPMEQLLDLHDMDIVFSVCAIGWTRDPGKVFKNVAAYLKPGGRFVWSGQHPIFDKLIFEDGNLIVGGSYFNEETTFEKNWSGSEGVYMQTRTLSSWIHHLSAAGFKLVEFLEPQPEVVPEWALDNTRFYSIAKARKVPCTVIFLCEKVM